MDLHEHARRRDPRGCRSTTDSDRFDILQSHALEQTRVTERQAGVSKSLAEELRALAEQQARLEADRRDLAKERWQHPLFAEVLAGSVPLLVCATALLLVLRLLVRDSASGGQEDARAVTDLLLEDFEARTNRIKCTHTAKRITSRGKDQGRAIRE